MAKKTVDQTSVTTSDLTYIETTEPTVRLPWSGQEVRVADIPPTSIAYLIQYGTNKTGQDAASGALAKAKEAHDTETAWNNGEGKEPSEAIHKAFVGWCKDLGLSTMAALDLSADTFARQVATMLSQARWVNVMSGKMELPGTISRLSQIDRVMAEIAESTLKARAKARGLKATAEQLKTLVPQLLASPEGERIRELAIARIDAEAQLAASASAGDGLDLSSLLTA